jgi:hypothetical protein
MRLLASALVLALFGLGSFWMWQEATGGEDRALEGVVLSEETSHLVLQPTEVVPGRAGTGPDLVAGVPHVIAQVWDRLGLGARQSAESSSDAGKPAAQDDEAATSTSDGATSSGPGKGGSSTSGPSSTSGSSDRGSSSGSGASPSEPEPVHRTHVDPDDDDDDDDDWDDDDDDDWDDD